MENQVFIEFLFEKYEKFVDFDQDMIFRLRIISKCTCNKKIESTQFNMLQSLLVKSTLFRCCEKKILKKLYLKPIYMVFFIVYFLKKNWTFESSATVRSNQNEKSSKRICGLSTYWWTYFWNCSQKLNSWMVEWSKQ